MWTIDSAEEAAIAGDQTGFTKSRSVAFERSSVFDFYFDCLFVFFCHCCWACRGCDTRTIFAKSIPLLASRLTCDGRTAPGTDSPAKVTRRGSCLVPRTKLLVAFVETPKQY